MSISSGDVPELEPIPPGTGVQAPLAANPFSPVSAASPTGITLTAQDLSTLMQQMVAATKAASDAAQAVSNMSQAGGSSGSRSLEARDLLKILPRPEPFKVDKLEDEHARWVSWYWQFRQYLCAIDSSFDTEISLIERDLHTEVTVMKEDTTARSFQLYALLSSLIKGRAFQIVKQVPQQRGYEALRLLLLQFQPPSKVRSLGILSALTQLKGFNSKEPYLPQILELERGFEQYEIASGEAVQASLKSALLLRSLSGVMRQHISATLPEDASYTTLREAILRYERTQFKWGTHNLFGSDSVLLGGAPKNQPQYDEPTPMDVDRVAWKGKGKGKGKGGKDGKGKGGKDGKGKGKHLKGGKPSNQRQQQPKGKGKGDKNGKGSKGKGKSSNKSNVECYTCGKTGHYQKDCWHNPQRVNQVAESAASSTIAPSAGASQAGQTAQQSTVRRLEAEWDDLPVLDFSEMPTLDANQVNVVTLCMNSQEPPECLSVLGEDRPGVNQADIRPCHNMSPSPCVHFDLTVCDDDNANWTVYDPLHVQEVDLTHDLEPNHVEVPVLEQDEVADLNANECHCSTRNSTDFGISMDAPQPHHAECTPIVRAVIHEVECADLEVILDSGADISCLPAELGWLGTKGTGAKMKVSDAQGGILPVKQHRDVEFIVETRSGRPVLWKEKCVVTSVTQPLLAMGKFMRAGWFPAEDGQGMYLRHGATGTEVPINFKGNSLMVQARLRRITESEEAQAQASQVTAEAQAQAAQVTTEAQAQAAQVTTEAQAQAAQVTTEAQAQAAPEHVQVRYTSAVPSQELVDASYGWQTLESTGHFVWRGLSANFIDPSLLVPLTWPYRSTLVYTEGGWKILELCVAWQNLRNPVAALPCGECQCIVVLSSGEEEPDLFGVTVSGTVEQHSGNQDDGSGIGDDDDMQDAPQDAIEPVEFAPEPPAPVADNVEIPVRADRGRC